MGDQQLEARMTAERRDAFRRWMISPEVRLLASMVPASGDILETLLEAAFIAGHNAGGAAFAMQAIHHLMMPKDKP